MKDKLRELAELDEAACVPVNRPNLYASGWNDCRSVALAILDAEGDGGAMATVGQPPEREELVSASLAIGGWLAAALDDPAVCAEMKRDINRWFDAAMPSAQTHPARSVVVSDEDVDGALDAYEDSTGPTGISPLRVPMRAALEAALSAQPAEPAAQAEAVSRDLLAIGVRARNMEITRQQRAGEPNNEDHALRVGIAAALAAQPRASEPAGRQGEAVASLRIFGVAGRTGVPSYALGRLPAMDRLPVGDYALYLHHAAPVGVGVPDGWKVQIDVGPEKAVHVTNPSGAWVGILGYVSQREQFLADFFRAQLAAAPSQGESNNG